MPLTKHDDWESVSLATNAKFMEIVELGASLSIRIEPARGRITRPAARLRKTS